MSKVTNNHSFDLLHVRQEKTLERVIDMVKYAESKNLALITFNTAIMVIACQIIQIDLTEWYHTVPVCFWFLSTLLAIISFVPIVQSSVETAYKGSNLLFFNTISTLKNKDYHQEVMGKLESDEHYLKMINDQISVNSRIASRKFWIFKLSIRLLFIATILLYVVEWYIKDKKSV